MFFVPCLPGISLHWQCGHWKARQVVTELYKHRQDKASQDKRTGRWRIKQHRHEQGRGKARSADQGWDWPASQSKASPGKVGGGSGKRETQRDVETTQLWAGLLNASQGKTESGQGKTSGCTANKANLSSQCLASLSFT
jgi:hypothetical protein